MAVYLSKMAVTMVGFRNLIELIMVDVHTKPSFEQGELLQHIICNFAAV